MTNAARDWAARADTSSMPSLRGRVLAPLVLFTALPLLQASATLSAQAEQPRAAQAEQPRSVLLSVTLPEGPSAGARLFAKKTCIRCHSLVEGETRIGPDLRRIVFAGNVLDLAGAFWNHAPVMREKMQELKIQTPTLTSGEIADIVALLTVYRDVTAADSSGNAEAGQAVFVAKGCAGCHEEGPDRAGLGPNLARYRGRYSAIFLAQAMWNHAPEMASVMRRRGVAWPQFAGSEMANLVAYLQTGGGSGADRVYFEPGSPRRGRELFEVKRCSACHAIAGVGGRGGPDLGSGAGKLRRSVAEIAGLMWNHSQGMSAEFRRRGIPRGTFSGQEMADIIAYVYFVNYANVRGVPARGGQLFREKCAPCHSAGGGRRVGPDLAAAPNLDDPMALIAAMWNHAPNMERELRRRELSWPRFESGEPADLAAFILVSRPAGAGTSPSVKR